MADAVAMASRHRALTENGSDLLVQTDLVGQITYMSPSIEAMTGFTPDELIGRTIAELVGEDTAQRLSQAVQDRIRHPEAPFLGVEYPAPHKDGRTIWLQAMPAPLIDPETGKMIGVTDVVRDITARKAAEEKLAFANVMLQVQMEASPSGKLVVDAASRIVAFNTKFAELWALTPEELRTLPISAVMDRMAALSRDPRELRERIEELRANPFADSHDEVWTTSGRCINRFSTPLRGAKGEYLGRAMFFHDITDYRNALENAVRAARFDNLTGLANRAVFVDTLNAAIAATRRGGDGFSVVFLDLDHFKDVNDTLGHAAGDELLKAVSRRLRAAVRRNDIIARFGGDEFAIHLAGVATPAAAGRMAEKLKRVLRDPFQIHGQTIHVGSSFGVDVYGPHARDAKTLLAHADLALYRAKDDGRGGWRLFNASMEREVHTRVNLAAELREAVASGQLFMLYQPQVDLRTRRVVGAEALMRWRHPTKGVLGPSLFIPVAEQMGLIGELGRWALAEACGQARKWLDEGLPPLRMAVNVSSLQFGSLAALESDIAAAMDKTGLSPDCLELEITETALMNATRGNGELLERLRQTGVKIALDDFGTGYSSLHYLSRFPVSRIKIAQDFVQGMDEAPANAAIIRATIGLARELGVAVIAEGVEKAEQVRALESWGCAEAQGYHFARPMAPELAAAYVRKMEPARRPIPALANDDDQASVG
ncbi:MAG: EAL domain-containing protein [Caulobacteraceae bacterium]|nr:EAL domain-containing protein [Caulobacteraceae bacterium]